MNLDELLDAFGRGDISRGELKRRLSVQAFQDMGCAKIDHHRLVRKHHGEVVFCEGKSPEQVASIFQELVSVAGRVLGTRASQEHFEAVRDMEHVAYDPQSRVLRCAESLPEPRGEVLLLSAGTSDLPVAEEAAQTLAFLGSRVVRYYDCGVAGIHRLLAAQEQLCSAHCVIAVAGMDGALPAVTAGLTPAPVIGVPTSVGYGAGAGGIAPLLTMLNSCAPGISVVNIDNGFGAAYQAHIINMQACDSK